MLLFVFTLACAPSAPPVKPPAGTADSAPDTGVGSTTTDDDPTESDPTESDPPESDPPESDPDTDLPESDPPESDPPDSDPALPETAADCFSGQWGSTPPLDYDQFGPVMGSHCMGTNHQDITDVERVVFIGDSITVGSPPTLTDDWYRNILADELVSVYGLDAPAWDWENVNVIDGVVLTMESGDFAACAKWGARTDDLLMDPHRQLETCIPEDRRELRTLVVMTIGGNDIYSLLEDINAGVDETTLRATYTEAVDLVREAAEWVKDPARFPNGAWLVFANTYDFTDPDGAMDMAMCPGAQLIGLDAPLEDPIFQDILAEAQEEYMSIAVDTQSDLVFLGEGFCGHGYNDDATDRCYRGASYELWLDFTCMHPNDLGHAAIAEMMRATIVE